MKPSLRLAPLLVALPIAACGAGRTDADGTVDAAAPSVLPTAPSATSASPHTFAIDNLYIGDTDKGTFTFDTNAWSSIGYNLDGLDTTSISATNVCTPQDGGVVVVDGVNGIDNSFGYSIAPLISDVLGYGSEALSKDVLQTGTSTFLLNIVGIDPSDPTQTVRGLSASVFKGDANDAGTAAFTADAGWPVDPSTVVGGEGAATPLTSTAIFSAGGVTNGQFVSGAPQDMPFWLPIGALALPVTVHAAVVTFQIRPDGTASDGLITGVLNVAEFEAAVTDWLGSLNTINNVCDSLSNVLTVVSESADIMTDGTNGPGTMCDGISLGIGFTAKEIAPPSVVAPPLPPDTPCAQP